MLVQSPPIFRHYWHRYQTKHTERWRKKLLIVEFMCNSVEEPGLTCGLDERLEAAEDKTKHFKLSIHLCLHTFTLNHQPVGVFYASVRTRCAALPRSGAATRAWWRWSNCEIRMDFYLKPSLGVSTLKSAVQYLIIYCWRVRFDQKRCVILQTQLLWVTSFLMRGEQTN